MMQRAIGSRPKRWPVDQNQSTAEAPNVNEPRPAAPALPYRWVIEGALLLLQFAMGLSFLAVAPLFPLIIDDFGVSRASASLLVGGTALGVALALIPCSMLAARLGTRAALGLAGVLMSAMALAPLADSFALLLGARITFAVGGAMNLTATAPVIMRWFPPRELPMVNGLNVVAQSLGVTMSMVIAPRLAAVVGWERTLYAFACVTMIGTLTWLLLARDPAGTRDGEGAPFRLGDLVSTLQNRPTVVLGLGLAGALGANVSFGSWLPTYYHEQFGFSLEKAGAVASVLALFGIFGSLLGSALPVRFPRRRPFLITAGFLMPITAIGTFATANPVVLYPSLALFGMVSWVFIPVVFTIPMELPGMTPGRVGVTTAVVLCVGNLSGFFAPLIVGAVRDATGAFALGLTVVSLLAAALALAGWLMPETGVVRPAEVTTGKG